MPEPARRRRAAGPPAESPEMRRLRRRIDALDRRLVALLNERSRVALDIGRAKAATGRRAVRDPEREREVLLRVTMANAGPLPQADLLALYRRLIAATRRLEGRDRQRTARPADAPLAGTDGAPPSDDETASSGDARDG